MARTAWGDVGMFVCADARMVEVPRTVAIRGARLLLDPTPLVLSPVGTNAQLEFMLAARAWENGAYLAVANKCGVEAGIADYAGRSAILDPSGARLAEAGSEDPEIITAPIDLAGASGPPIPRVPDRYPELAMPVDELPIARVLSSPPPATTLRLAMLGPEHRMRSECSESCGGAWRSGRAPRTSKERSSPTLGGSDPTQGTGGQGTSWR